MVCITLKDGIVREFDSGTTAAEVAKSLGSGLFKAACACKIDGALSDLRCPLTADCKLDILTFDDEDGRRAFRHTASHILAQAVKRLYPQAKLAIGPAIENGFYYDFDLEAPLTPEALEGIAAEMRKITKEALPITRFELPPEEALAHMQAQGENYKVELIQEHADKGENISFYKQGEFEDLCAGPHLLDTGRVKAFALTACTGAYWRGDANNKMLQRVYGTAFPKKDELEAHLAAIEEAKKRDHRRLGKDLELFTFMDEGPGFPFFLPKGMLLKNQLLDFWRALHIEKGYQEISTPIMLSRHLWETSGHWGHYQKNMYTTVIDEQDFAVKPMNCPGGMLVFQSKRRSYRELPLRIGELGLVHRHELSGALHGLMRVRCFTQDDAHIFMTPEQIKDEIRGVVEIIDTVYKKTFGFQYHIELSTQPEDSMGAKETWDAAIEMLRDAITEMGYNYKLNEGDGAFYGPKLDFHLTDCLGRTWQCGTIQLDFQMPERFQLEYMGADDLPHRPIMIHRVVLGSIERFIGILTEHFAGAFPLWLSPEQVRVLPISDRHQEAAHTLLEQLRAAGLRVSSDDRSEKIGYKIREAQLQRLPYMLLIGDKETESGTVSIRKRGAGDLGAVPVAEFLQTALQEAVEKTIF